MEEIIKKAVEVMREGGVILYPTDTIWGIGCDAANAEAVEKIYRIKERDHNKSMLILVAEQPEGITLPTIDSRPTTYIVPAQRLPYPLAENLIAQDGTIGFRIPRHDFCQRLIAALGSPIVSTSANFSGKPSPRSFEEIDERLKEEMGYCVPPMPAFESGEKQGSRIIKITPEGVIVIRG